MKNFNTEKILQEINQAVKELNQQEIKCTFNNKIKITKSKNEQIKSNI